MNVKVAAPTSARSTSLRKGVRLEYFTIGWNLLEAAVGLAAGIIAGSVALVGFALDSVVEASSGTILLWRLRAERRGATVESVERKAVRLLAVAFFALALYVAARAIFALGSGARPEESQVGIALALVSLVVMPILARQKREVARELDSRSLEGDSAQTMLCMYLSAILLAGLVTNSFFGWWWADPVAAFGIAGMAAREGRELWTTEDLCCR